MACCGQSSDPADADDATIVRVGPLTDEALDRLSSHDISLRRKCGIFVDREIRVAFERHQHPFVQRRRIGVLFAVLIFQLFQAIRKSINSDAVDRGEMSAPVWYGLGVVATYATFCLVTFCSLGPILRLTRCNAVGGVRTGDCIFALMIGGFLLVIPRIWEGEDPYDLAGAMPERSLHSIRIAALSVVVGASGIFFNPGFALVAMVAIVQAYVSRFNDLLRYTQGLQADGMHAGGLQEASELMTNCTRAPLDDLLDERTMRVMDFWIIFFIAPIVMLQHEMTVFEQFRLECTVQRVAARRVEQLSSEKERLDYERQMNGKQTPSPPAPGLSEAAESLAESVEEPGQLPPFPKGTASSRGDASIVASSAASCEELAAFADCMAEDREGVQRTPSAVKGRDRRDAVPRAASARATACTAASAQSSQSPPSLQAAVQPPNPGAETIGSNPPAGLAPPTVRSVAELSWPERQKLSRTCWMRPAHSDGGSSAASTGTASSAVALNLTCTPRQAALWRSLEGLGLGALPGGSQHKGRSAHSGSFV